VCKYHIQILIFNKKDKEKVYLLDVIEKLTLTPWSVPVYDTEHVYVYTVYICTLIQTKITIFSKSKHFFFVNVVIT